MEIVDELKKIIGTLTVNEKEYIPIVCLAPIHIREKASLAFSVVVLDDFLLIAQSYVEANAILENRTDEINKTKLELVNQIKRWKEDVRYEEVEPGIKEYKGFSFEGLNSKINYLWIENIKYSLDEVLKSDLSHIKKDILHQIKAYEQEKILKLLQTQEKVVVVRREISLELQKLGMCIDKYRALIINPMITSEGIGMYGYESIIIK